MLDRNLYNLTVEEEFRINGQLTGPNMHDAVDVFEELEQTIQAREEETDELQMEVHSLANCIQELEEKVDDLTTDLDNAKAEIAERDITIGSLANRLRMLDAYEEDDDDNPY